MSVGSSLYNRYRPTDFSDLVGQDHIAQALRNTLRSGRPAQGYLFSGPRGTGKTTTARILARCLNCQRADGPTPDIAGCDCDSCRRTGHPDWLDVVEVDAASSARRIDEMREWLESVRYAPVASRYRITIMDEAHQIQEGAASALLKTLEEPPPHLVVILCTTHPWELLGTIRSRLQHYVLRKPGIPDLVSVLRRVAEAEGIAAGPEALDLLARAADGSYRDALGLLEMISTYADGRVEVADALELLGAPGREVIFDLADHVTAGEPAPAFHLLERALDEGTDPEQVLIGLTTHLRYACLLQQGARARDEWAFAQPELERLSAQAARLAPARVVRALDLIADAAVRIRQGGVDPRLQLELVIAKMATPALDSGGAGPAATAAPEVRPAVAEGAAGPPPPRAVEPAPRDAPRALDATATNPDALIEPAPDAIETTAPAPTGSPGGPGHLWQNVLADLREQSPPVHGMLEDARLDSVGDTSAVIVVPSKMRLAMLERPDHRGRLRAVLTLHLGAPVDVELVHAPPAATETAAAPQMLDEDALRHELATMFNAVRED